MTTESTLFTDSTSERARKVAAAMTGERYRQIMASLRQRPKCLFEVAAELGCFDHQISGRFTDLRKLGIIERTGERRVKPATGCSADVYRIVGDLEGDE